MFPAASVARIVTIFQPTRSGIDADHCAVPAATPELPVLVDHVTAFTPTLSLAAPLKVNDAADVEIIVPEGDVIVTDGGVVSLGLGGVDA
jgi:hypothetical protein